MTRREKRQFKKRKKREERIRQQNHRKRCGKDVNPWLGGYRGRYGQSSKSSGGNGYLDLMAYKRGIINRYQKFRKKV